MQHILRKSLPPATTINKKLLEVAVHPVRIGPRSEQGVGDTWEARAEHRRLYVCGKLPEPRRRSI